MILGHATAIPDIPIYFVQLYFHIPYLACHTIFFVILTEASGLKKAGNLLLQHELFARNVGIGGPYHATKV